MRDVLYNIEDELAEELSNRSRLSGYYGVIMVTNKELDGICGLLTLMYDWECVNDRQSGYKRFKHKDTNSLIKVHVIDESFDKERDIFQSYGGTEITTTIISSSVFRLAKFEDIVPYMTSRMRSKCSAHSRLVIV